MLEQIWKPDTYFLNGKESYLHKVPTSNRLVRLSREGTVLYSSRLLMVVLKAYDNLLLLFVPFLYFRLTIKASCPMNLQNFPLDTQVRYYYKV